MLKNSNPNVFKLSNHQVKKMHTVIKMGVSPWARFLQTVKVTVQSYELIYTEM